MKINFLFTPSSIQERSSDYPLWTQFLPLPSPQSKLTHNYIAVQRGGYSLPFLDTTPHIRVPCKWLSSYGSALSLSIQVLWVKCSFPNSCWDLISLLIASVKIRSESLKGSLRSKFRSLSEECIDY